MTFQVVASVLGSKNSVFMKCKSFIPSKHLFGRFSD